MWRILVRWTVMLCATGSFVAPAWAEAASPGPGMAQLAQLILGLIVVIVGVLVLAKLLARVHGGRGSANGQLRVVAAVAVGQKERIVLMQVGPRQLLLGVTPGQISRLHELEAPLGGIEDVQPATAAPNWLARTLGRS